MKQMYASKKALLSAGFAASFSLLLYSCQKDASVSDQPTVTTGTHVQITKRSCATNEVLQQQLAKDPSLRDRMNQIEAFTQKYVAHNAFNYGATQRGIIPNGAIINVPVVVNIVYNTPEQNISNAQVQSQIDVLNEDFNRMNADAINTPEFFRPVAANVAINFQLKEIKRKLTKTAVFQSNDEVKTDKKGINPTEPDKTLNIWVCNLGDGLLGYSQFPGGRKETDGVVILYSAFGRTGNLIDRFNLGRTTTHEVGHWMNLRHIWGDARCGDDLVADTPQAEDANVGRPNFPKHNSCTVDGVEMTMNYMDYTDDGGMNMFSAGQKTRMQAVFASGGPRAAYNRVL